MTNTEAIVAPDHGPLEEGSLDSTLSTAPSHALEAELRRRQDSAAEDSEDADRAGRQTADVVEHRERRERELASLYATARSLAVLAETDDVLATIVRHAHELTGTDLTYLSVFNEAQTELSLRAAEGAISADFRHARVPAQTGVAGEVLRTRAAYWVDNYAKADVLHDPEFDATVAKEGVVALLGVPLVAGDRIFGVLYAANRVERSFPRDEVALLSAFADHAAVALENARLYEEARRALRDLEDAYATIEDQVHVMERSATVHEALTRVILTGGGIGEIAELLLEALGGHVIMLDRRDKVLAIRGAPNAEAAKLSEHADLASAPALAAELRGSIDESLKSGRCVTARGDGTVLRTIASVLAGDDYLGAVILSRATDLSPVERRTLERAAQITGLLTLKQDAVIQAEERVRGEILAEILNSRQPYSAELSARARARDLELERLRVVLIIEAPHVRPSQIVGHIRGSGGCQALVGEHHGLATALVESDDAAATAARVHRQLKAAIDSPVLVCGAGLSSTETATHGFSLASRCCKLARHLGIVDRSVTTDELAVYALLFDPDRSHDLETFLDGSLRALIEYDAKGRTDLIATLAAYFATSANLTRTARALHVHINTLLKRLERVTELLGADWREPDNALRLQVAVRMYQLSRELAAEPD